MSAARAARRSAAVAILINPFDKLVFDELERFVSRFEEELVPDKTERPVFKFVDELVPGEVERLDSDKLVFATGTLVSMVNSVIIVEVTTPLGPSMSSSD